MTRSTRAHWCRRRWSSSRSSSSADATRSVVQPRNGVSAADAARAGEDGRSIASSRRSQSRAGAVPKTLPAPLMTAGMSTSSRASRISAALRWVRTRTATWPGRMRSRRWVVPSWSRISISASEESSAARSAGEVLGDVLARRGVADAAAARERQRRLVAVDHPDAQRRVDGRLAEPRRLVRVRGLDLPVDDALVPELRAAQQRVVGVDQRPGRCAS